MSGKRIVVTVGVLLLIGIMIQVLFDPLSSAKHSFEIVKAQVQLPSARAKWEALKITDYRFEVRGVAPLLCLPHAIIEVKNETVVKVKTKDLGLQDAPVKLLPPYQWADPDWGNEVFLCDYANFTMTQIFDLVELTLENDPSIILHTEFDPDYGFVTSFSYGLFLGNGLLSPGISDCCSSFRIENFQPKP